MSTRYHKRPGSQEKVVVKDASSSNDKSQSFDEADDEEPVTEVTQLKKSVADIMAESIEKMRKAGEKLDACLESIESGH